ncbi:MAG TPA: hypothetical protein VFS00_28545, partial [Polyangiaceae bacterium]|nr:hypothetical protein [Polyangiaceae bacterium]
MVLADAAGGLEGGGAQGLGGRHSGADEPAELALVLAAHREHRVGAHGDGDAALVGARGGGQVLREEGLEAAAVGGRVAVLGAVLAVVAVVVDGRHVDGAPAGHLGEGGVVEALGVLERVGARAHGDGGGGGVVGVHGDGLAQAVRLVDRGGDGLVGEDLRAVQAAVGALVGPHLEEVDAERDDAPDLGAHAPDAAV